MRVVCEFRPRRARYVAWALLVALWVGVVAILILSWTVFERFGPADQILTVAFCLAVSVVIARHAMVRAVATSKTLTVRNLMITTQVEWEQIVGVNFSIHRPWVSLDLADGDTLPVMAIQSADGEMGRMNAQRLAELVEAHEAPDSVS